MRYEKVYVAVVLRVDTEGKMKPLAVEWEDGRKFDVAQSSGGTYAVPRHVGGTLTVRYDCAFGNGRRTLFREEDTGRWFVEKPSTNE